MRFTSNRSIFGIAVLFGIVLVLAPAGYEKWKRDVALAGLHRLTASISVTEQLSLDAIPRLQGRGFTTIIDMRPDGEAIDQPSSAAVGAAVNAEHMRFVYVPVPHGDIPDAAVATLDKALAEAKGPVLLYCRSGRRAARTWSLVEASRPGGLDASTIKRAVKASGQSADDLDAAIQQRIANRAKTPGGSI